MQVTILAANGRQAKPVDLLKVFETLKNVKAVISLVKRNESAIGITAKGYFRTREFVKRNV